MANESYSVYPSDIDGYATLPLRQDGIHEIVAADHNRLRDAIVKIEQELGIQPSGTFATVSSRLDDIGDAKALITAHIANTTGAHAASAISLLDSANYYISDDVEEALEELAFLLPPLPDTIGNDNDKIPNDGIPSFYDGYGTKFVFNISSADAIHKRTQPSAIGPGIKGIHIYEVSDQTDNGDGYLRITGDVGTEMLEWLAPGDECYGDPVDVSALTEGDSAVISSSNTLKKIRITKSSSELAQPGGGELVEHFEVYSAEFVPGYYSLESEGFQYTNHITRTAISESSGISRLQCMFKGNIYPADRGTLVLQRKLRGVSGFFPVAILALGTNFVESARLTGQKVYVPSMSNFDTITLYDRFPLKEDYTLVPPGANGSPPFDDFESDFPRLQMAKFLIPLSNSDIIGATLTTPDDTTISESNDSVSAFRIIHYKETATTTSFVGNPASTDIYSAVDSGWDADEHDLNSTVTYSNVYVDSSPTRPGIELVNLRFADPSGAPAVPSTTMRSGVKYFNSSSDLFDVEVRSDNNVFNKTYVRSGILTFETDVFNFPNGIDDGVWGASVDVDELVSHVGYTEEQTDGYFKWGAANLPAHSDQTFYMVNDVTLIDGLETNAARRIYPAPNRFSNHSFIRATFHDPFGPGDGYDAYGSESVHRILTNSYSITRATDTVEYFTDESKRIDDEVEFTDTGDFTAFDNTSVLPGLSLQVGGRFTSDEFNVPGLIYPQQDYYNISSRILPTQVDDTDMDYSNDPSPGYGHRRYQRLFSLGYPISSGQLRIVSDGNNPITFEDIRQGNLDRFGKIEIKIPGLGTNSTEWLDLGRLFATGEYEDGYGALYGEVTGGTGDFAVPFSFGTRNTAETSNALALRITYFGVTESQRQASKEKIITMIQLLT